MKIYGVLDFNQQKNEDLWPIATTDFSTYLKQAKEYARQTFKKPIADGLARMLPALETGELKRIEVDEVIFRVSEGKE